MASGPDTGTAPPAASHPRADRAGPAWPTSADVAAELRLPVSMPAEDQDVLDSALAAAIAWVDSRTGQAFRDSSGDVLVPDDGWYATVLAAARLYRRRDTIDGTIGWADMGVIRIGRFDPDVEALLGRYLPTVM